MEVDIKSKTASELLTLRSEIDLRLNALAKELEKRLLQIRGDACDEGRSTSKKRGGIASFGLSHKCRNPADPSQTWLERGKRPNWLVASLTS